MNKQAVEISHVSDEPMFEHLPCTNDQYFPRFSYFVAYFRCVK